MNNLLEYANIDSEQSEFFLYPCKLIDVLTCIDPDRTIESFSFSIEDDIELDDEKVIEINSTEDFINYLHSIPQFDHLEAEVDYDGNLKINATLNDYIIIQYDRNSGDEAILKKLFDQKQIDWKVMNEIQSKPLQYFEVSPPAKFVEAYPSFDEYVNRRR